MKKRIRLIGSVCLLVFALLMMLFASHSVPQYGVAVFIGAGVLLVAAISLIGISYRK